MIQAHLLDASGGLVVSAEKTTTAGGMLSCFTYMI
jgi:hypothetical protein